MRHIMLLALVLVLGGVPGTAGSNAGLPYTLTFSPAPGVLLTTGAVRGTFGGVPVTGMYSGGSTAGTLNLIVGGKLFASGTYLCRSGCAFTGMVAGTSLTGENSLALTGRSTLTSPGKATSSAFPSRDAWVLAVTGWAHANLIGRERGQIILAALKR